MKTFIIKLIASIIAAGIVMIIHEFPKAFVYNILNKEQDKKKKKQIFKLYHYIDPIGMLLCLSNQAGFSKPYMYRIKDPKTNMILGITGYLSLLITFLVSILVIRFGLRIDSGFTYNIASPFGYILLQFIVVYIALNSISMFIINLFPLSTFDMGLCIAGKSPSKYFTIIRNDYLFKMMLLLLILFRLIPTVGTLIISNFL